MGSSNVRDLLTAFSPLLDLLAISAGDGRIKIWDTVKGQLQTEFADLVASEETSIFSAKPERGHLSVDYTCMKWFCLERKKKRKLGCSLLVLGTGSGDVLALDVAAGHLKWKVNDCHPGGVSAISFARHGSCIYTAGYDGIVCEIDPLTGNLLQKFKASAKALSSMSVSPDSKLLATASAQMKVFNCSDHKKIQKFSGHPGAVRCLIFTEDGKHILSSAVGERNVAVWRIGGGKRQSASCVLAMEHPAVFLDSWCINSEESEGSGLYVLAISEIGVCYVWFGNNVEELGNAKPTKVSVSYEDTSSKSYIAALPAIFAAKLQGSDKPASGNVFVAYGLLVKPLFRKVLVQSGTDIKLNSSYDGVLLPMRQSHVKSKKQKDVQNGVIVLDRANAEDALLPIPKIFDSHVKKKIPESLNTDMDHDRMVLVSSRSDAESVKRKDDTVEMEVDTDAICMEDRLKSLGILSEEDNVKLNSALFKGVDIEGSLPQKKIKEAVLSKTPNDTLKLLGALVDIWQSRSRSGKYVLPWIQSILVNHSHHRMSQEPMVQMLNSLFKITKHRGAAIQPLLQLSGRLQLVMAQINKAIDATTEIRHEPQMDESDDEDPEDVDDVLFTEELDESELSSEDDE